MTKKLQALENKHGSLLIFLREKGYREQMGVHNQV